MPNYKDYIRDNLISNKIEIFFPDNDGTTITEDNIVSESMQLKQSLCDESALRFGGCIAAEFRIDLLNTTERSFTQNDLADKWISVKITQTYATDIPVLPADTLYPSDNLYPGTTIDSRSFWIFSGYIDSAKLSQNDSNVRTVVAYDVLAKLHTWDGTNKLFALLKNSGYTTDSGNPATLVYNLRTACLNDNGHMSIPIDESLSTYFMESYTSSNGTNTKVDWFFISNQDWMGNQNKISFGEILRRLCEMVAVFGYIAPDGGKGKFAVTALGGSGETYSFYENLKMEEYESAGYSDIKYAISGSGRFGKYDKSGISVAPTGLSSEYDFTKNILIWEDVSGDPSGAGTAQYGSMVNRTTIGRRLALNASSMTDNVRIYRPLEATLEARLWLTLGETIRIVRNKTTPDGAYIDDGNGGYETETIRSFALSRTLTGIQALTDVIIAKGEPYHESV